MSFRLINLIRGGLLAALLGGACAAVASPTVPQTIRYQGRLLQAGGTPVNGPVSIAVSLYDAATAGSLLWTQQTATVTVNDGAYEVVIGGAGFADALTDGSAWLELTVDGDTLTPRQRMPSVPYAFFAENLAGNVLVVDRPAGRAGVNVASPTATFDIDGQLRLRGGNPQAGYVLHSDTNGVGEWRKASGAPSGLIIQWYGDPTNVPSGWLLCDGLNGTPDLQDRFVRAAGTGLVEGTLGGSATHVHGVDIPATTTSSGGSHTHSVSFPSTTTSSDGAHTHSANPPSATTSSGGSHSHSGGSLSFHRNVSLIDTGWAPGDWWFFYYTGSTGSRLAPSWLGSTGSAGNHNHSYNIGSFTSASAGNHSHSVTLPSATSASAGDHAHTFNPAVFDSEAASSMPAYAVLCFIMKE